MNPFDANERHRYIIESGGNPVSSADGKEKEIWVNSINIDIDTPIYRYMKWEYLQQFYSEPMHEWILVRPCLWQDKFEQFIFKCDSIIAQTNCTLFTNETYKKTFFRSI